LDTVGESRGFQGWRCISFPLAGSTSIGAGASERAASGYVDKIVVTTSNCVENPVGAERACKRLNAKFKAHPEMQAWFEREITTLRVLEHPNIMTCVGENLPESNERFYVMPLYSSSLRKFMQAGRRQATGEARVSPRPAGPGTCGRAARPAGGTGRDRPAGR